MKNDTDEMIIIAFLFILACVIGFCIEGVIDGTYDLNPQSGIMKISNQTAIDICKNLGNQSINYDVKVIEGKLICLEPSYDNPQNIKFEVNK